MSGGGGSQNTTTQTSGPPPQVLQNYQALTGAAQNVAQQPLQQYSGPLVAGFTPQQQASFGQAAQAGGIGIPYLNAASQEFGAATTPSYETVGNYISPYTQNVTSALTNLFNQQNATQQQQIAGNATTAGAYGGDREAVAQALAAQQENLAQAPTLAQTLQQGYQTALGANQAQQWLESQAAFGMGGLGTQAQNMLLAGANANYGAGAAQQGLAQEQLNVPYQQFIASQAYPYQQLGFLSPIVEGTGSLSGGTGTTTSPGPSTLGQIGGLATAGAGVAGLANQSGLFSGFGSNNAPAFASTLADGAGDFGGGAGLIGDFSGIKRGGNVHAHRARGGVTIPILGGIGDEVPSISLSFIPQEAAGGTPSSGALSPLQPDVTTTQTQSSSGGGAGDILGGILGIGKLAATAFLKDGGRAGFDQGGNIGSGFSAPLPAIPTVSLDKIIKAGPEVKGGGPPHAPNPPPQQGGSGAPDMSGFKELGGLFKNSGDKGSGSSGGIGDDSAAASDDADISGSAVGGRAHRQAGGIGSDGVPLGVAIQSGGAPPQTQQQLQQLTQLPLNRLQEMAVQFPPNTQQGQLVALALKQKQAQAGAGTVPSSGAATPNTSPAAGTSMPLTNPAANASAQTGTASVAQSGQDYGGTAHSMASGGDIGFGAVSEDELDPHPVVDHSGENVVIRYPSEGKKIDLGIPSWNPRGRYAAGGAMPQVTYNDGQWSVLTPSGQSPVVPGPANNAPLPGTGGGTGISSLPTANGVAVPQVTPDAFGLGASSPLSGATIASGGGGLGSWFQPMGQYQPPGTTTSPTGGPQFPSYTAYTPGMAGVLNALSPGAPLPVWAGGSPAPPATDASSSTTPAATAEQIENARIQQLNDATTQANTAAAGSGGGGKRGGNVAHFDDGGDTATALPPIVGAGSEIGPSELPDIFGYAPGAKEAWKNEPIGNAIHIPEVSPGNWLMRQIGEGGSKLLGDQPATPPPARPQETKVPPKVSGDVNTSDVSGLGNAALNPPKFPTESSDISGLGTPKQTVSVPVATARPLATGLDIDRAPPQIGDLGLDDDFRRSTDPLHNHVDLYMPKGGIGETAPPTGTPTASEFGHAGQTIAPGGGDIYAIGDSHAGGLIHGGLKGTMGRDPSVVNADAANSRTPEQVYKFIASRPDGYWNGKSVVLSTGVSNDPSGVDLVPWQLAKLKEAGANVVGVAGFGPIGAGGTDMHPVADKVARYAGEAGVPAGGVFENNLEGDHVHLTGQGYTQIANWYRNERGGAPDGKTFVPGSFIKGQEGFAPRAAQDVPGINAIGYGHDITSTDQQRGYIEAVNPDGTPGRVPLGGTVTSEQAEAIFRKDSQDSANAIRQQIPTFDRLTPLQQEALISYHYNTGHIPDGMAEKIAAGDFGGASELLKNGIKTGRGIGYMPALAQRRAEEAELMLNHPVQPHSIAVASGTSESGSGAGHANGTGGIGGTEAPRTSSTESGIGSARPAAEVYQPRTAGSRFAENWPMFALATGAGMLASRSHFPGVALGEGLKTGVGALNTERTQDNKDEVSHLTAQRLADQTQHQADQTQLRTQQLADMARYHAETAQSKIDNIARLQAAGDRSEALNRDKLELAKEVAAANAIAKQAEEDRKRAADAARQQDTAKRGWKTMTGDNGNIYRINPGTGEHEDTGIKAYQHLTGDAKIYQDLIDSGAVKDEPEAIQKVAQWRRDPRTTQNSQEFARLVSQRQSALQNNLQGMNLTPEQVHNQAVTLVQRDLQIGGTQPSAAAPTSQPSRPSQQSGSGAPEWARPVPDQHYLNGKPIFTDGKAWYYQDHTPAQ